MTRQEYLNDRGDTRAAFRAYYSQFVTDGTKQAVLRVIPRDKLIKSTDDHLNNIPLQLWDAVFPFGAPSNIVAKMRELGDYPTMAGLVCIAKEAARQILEENEEEP